MPTRPGCSEWLLHDCRCSRFHFRWRVWVSQQDEGAGSRNCLQMEIVTATGQRIVAYSQEHRHLFWVLRGAGQVGYGVVTKLQVKLHTLQEQYVGGEGPFYLEAFLGSIKKII